jgi:hypothetical protein
MRTFLRTKSVGVSAIGLMLVLGALAVPAGTAAASSPPPTLWVNNSVTPVAGDGTSCTQAGFTSVQAAVNAAEAHAKATIAICPGTYAEQVQITGRANLTIRAAKPNVGATLALPASPVASTTPCDTAPGTGSYQPDQDGFAVCGTHKTTVTVIGITFDEAWPAGTCNDSLYGILVGGGDTLKLQNSAIVAGGAVPINGCQGGIGIQIGMAWTTPNEAGHASVSNTSISGYQKNGVTVDGKGSTATFFQDTVSGAGPTTQTAQNGIQVSNGAYAKIQRSTITGNECNNPTCGLNALTDYQAAGVLFYGAAKGSIITDSTVSKNDIGMYYAASQSTLPASPDVSATFSKFILNRDEGVLFDQGRASLSDDNINRSNVGIMFVQYKGQLYGDHATVTRVRINNNSVAAIQVLSDQASSGDLPGAATFTRCAIFGAILGNASNYKLTFTQH